MLTVGFRKCLIVCLIQIFFIGRIHSQVYLEDPTPIEFLLRVKQIGEFMDRFNRDRCPEGLDMSSDFSDARCIAMLFDKEFAMKDTLCCMDFCHTMVSNRVRLHYQDTNWTAVAELDATLNGKPVDVFLKLKPERTSDGAYKWVLCDAGGSAIMLPAVATNPGQVIMPTDNEMNFMSLPDVIETQYQNIVNYTSNTFSIDPLSVFLTLVKYKHLKVNSVSRLRYVFNVHPYSFEVSYIYRETLNSGWLITDIQKIKEPIEIEQIDDHIKEIEISTDSIPVGFPMHNKQSDE